MSTFRDLINARRAGTTDKPITKSNIPTTGNTFRDIINARRNNQEIKKSFNQPVLPSASIQPQPIAPTPPIAPALPSYSKNTLPRDLGGGSYYSIPGQPNELVRPEAKKTYGSLPVKQGHQRDHFIAQSLGGASDDYNLNYVPSEVNQKWGNIETKNLNAYKRGEISLPQARLNVLKEKQEWLLKQKGISQSVKDNLIQIVKDPINPVNIAKGVLKKITSPLSLVKDYAKALAPKQIAELEQTPDNKSMRFEVSNVEKVLPGPRISTLQAINQGAKIEPVKVGEAPVISPERQIKTQLADEAGYRKEITGGLSSMTPKEAGVSLSRTPLELAKQAGSNVVGLLDLVARSGLQTVSAVGSVVSPAVVSVIKAAEKELMPDSKGQFADISYDQIWKDAMEAGEKRMLDIGRPDEYFRSKITGTPYQENRLFMDEIEALAKSSNEKMASGDTAGSFKDAGKIGGYAFMRDMANPFFLFSVRGISSGSFKMTPAEKTLYQIQLNPSKEGFLGKKIKVKPKQAVYKIDVKPKYDISVDGGKVKVQKSPNVKMYVSQKANGVVDIKVTNSGGEIFNKDIIKASFDKTGASGLPAVQQTFSAKPVVPSISPANPATPATLARGATSVLPKPIQTPPIKPQKAQGEVLPPKTTKVSSEAKPKTPLVSKTDDLVKEAKKYKSADEFVKEQGTVDLLKLRNEAEKLKNKFQKTQSGADLRVWRKKQNEIENIERDIAKNSEINKAIEQRKIDEKLRQTDHTVDKLSNEDFDFLTNEAKKTDNLDEFIGKVRGSATQYGEYNPKLRKYLRPESVFVGDIKGLNPNTKITVYRGIDAKSVAGKQIKTGDFVTTDFDDALGYTDSPSKVVSKEVRLKDLIEEYPDEIDITNPLKPVSYELIYNPTGKINKITKSQLEDIWNKANKSR